MTIRSPSRTVLEALSAVMVSNNGRQALPLLVRPRYLPGNQKGPRPRVYRAVERSAFCLESERRNKDWSFGSRNPAETFSSSNATIDPCGLPLRALRAWGVF